MKKNKKVFTYYNTGEELNKKGALIRFQEEVDKLKGIYLLE